ncbi:SDR family oxidoreductase [Salinibacterium sp. NG22]|uniref:SDR family NAD(P)-dependent oxidoreductase n=1 Tax=Salinibacterium sp. NG22 TaxID=2792040 RepID=UPI0018CCE9E8|nr:SDR family NAD(P)-dependent oxidoreductase [Salinibacterium sp. NG22]MBH0110427.1 SDR family oxidoreductase [Salinibacterium sp. NG22]
MIDLTSRRVLVTGGGRGIGAGIALGLARAGADVVVHYNGSADEAAETVGLIQALGGQALAVQADLTDSAQADRLVATAAEFLGGLDIVVTNAGHLVGRAPVATMSDDHWMKVLDVNLASTFYVCRAAIAHLEMSSAGRIVTMASLAAENGGGGGAVAYATSKAGVVGFTRALAKELAAKNITVNSLAPGFIEGTPFHDTFTPDDARAGIIAGIPIGRAGNVDDVAGAVLYLASDLASFVTGQVIDINGGVNFR